MGDFVIVTGDTVTATFTTTVIPAAQAPQPLIGSSTDLAVGGAFVCLEGDELPPALRVPLPYTEPPFTVPGTGTLKFVLGMGTNTTRILVDGGKAALIKGGPFQAIFTVAQQAKTPKGESDPAATKTGTASFTTTNSVLTAD